MVEVSKFLNTFYPSCGDVLLAAVGITIGETKPQSWSGTFKMIHASETVKACFPHCH